MVKADNYIFIHVPKTAGVSVHHYLTAVSPDAVTRVDGGTGTLAFYHPRASEVRDIIGQPAWDASFTFAFVRNPWARMVSWYCMALQRHHPRLSALEPVRAMTFTEFLHRDISLVLHSQLDFISDDQGRILMDFVGRYERLDADFASVCRRLGLPEGKLGHYNATRHPPWRSYYSADDAAVVARRFAGDITAFGYKL